MYDAPGTGSCEDVNERSASIRDGEFLDCVSYCNLLKKLSGLELI
jgi:hypothetical protein